ncbi:uncharacterized protein TNCV_2318261 [Trichonephila clavipes]|nr:uncharacterized protein TNCV_2318261 [Trichonephila clavipes]
MERSYLFFSCSLVARTYDVSNKNVDSTDVTSSQYDNTQNFVYGSCNLEARSKEKADTRLSNIFFLFPCYGEAAVAEWSRYRIVAGLITSSSPVLLKTRRVGQRCMLNLSRAQTSSRWCGVVARRRGCQLRCRPRHLTMVQNYVVRRRKPSCSLHTPENRAHPKGLELHSTLRLV